MNAFPVFPLLVALLVSKGIISKKIIVNNVWNIAYHAVILITVKNVKKTTNG